MSRSTLARRRLTMAAMSSRNMQFALVCCFGLAVAACAPDVQVRATSLPASSFTQYRTFSFGPPEAAPPGYSASSRSTDVRRRVEPIVSAVLQQKGYVLVQDQKADLVVELATGSRERLVKR